MRSHTNSPRTVTDGENLSCASFDPEARWISHADFICKQLEGASKYFCESMLFAFQTATCTCMQIRNKGNLLPKSIWKTWVSASDAYTICLLCVYPWILGYLTGIFPETKSGNALSTQHSSDLRLSTLFVYLHICSLMSFPVCNFLKCHHESESQSYTVYAHMCLWRASQQTNETNKQTVRSIFLLL